VLAATWCAGHFQIFRVSGESMMNTFYNGQTVIVNTFYSTPKRGDVIVATIDYEGEKKEIIKRVIGVEGDCVEIKHNHLYVNDEIVSENYVKDEDWIEGSELWLVPENSCFVLGDNRNDSLDSRFDEVGFVSYRSVVGKVLR
jgi:signal peptidase I